LLKHLVYLLGLQFYWVQVLLGNLLRSLARELAGFNLDLEGLVVAVRVLEADLVRAGRFYVKVGGHLGRLHLAIELSAPRVVDDEYDLCVVGGLCGNSAFVGLDEGLEEALGRLTLECVGKFEVFGAGGS